MEFDQPFIEGEFLARPTRFRIGVRLPDGRLTSAHCPNTGTLRSCLEPGRRVLLSEAENKSRSNPYTFEMIHNGVCWIGVHTGRANDLAEEAFRGRKIDSFADWDFVRREVKINAETRLDVQLKHGDETAFIEVKNVTWCRDGVYLFPDAVTTRGTKHLNTLIELRGQGHRTAMLYIVQRTDGVSFAPAGDVDPEYARTLSRAIASGVEILVFSVHGDERGYHWKCPVDLDPSFILNA